MKGVEIFDTTISDSNLTVDCFRNGEKLSQANNQEQWTPFYEKEVPAFYKLEENDSESYFYNVWAIIDDRKLAPKGWKITSDSDFDQLREIVRKENYKTEEEFNDLYWEIVKVAQNCFEDWEAVDDFLSQNRSLSEKELKSELEKLGLSENVLSKVLNLCKESYELERILMANRNDPPFAKKIKCKNDWNGTDDFGLSIKPNGYIPSRFIDSQGESLIYKRGQDAKFWLYDEEQKKMRILRIFSTSDKNDFDFTNVFDDQTPEDIRLAYFMEGEDYISDKEVIKEGMSVRCTKIG